RCAHQRRITPISKVTRKITTKMKNSTLAISVAPAAMPPKPNTAAMIAMMKKIAAYRSMGPPTDGLLDLHGKRRLVVGTACFDGLFAGERNRAIGVPRPR